MKSKESTVENAKTKTGTEICYRNLGSIPAKIGLFRKINSNQAIHVKLNESLQLHIWNINKCRKVQHMNMNTATAELQI